MSNQKKDSDVLIHSPRKHRNSRKRHNQDDEYIREYRHGRIDWRACYRDHDSFMNTLRWMHSRMRTPISEESESESLTDTTSAASISTDEPSLTTSLSDSPVRKKHMKNNTAYLTPVRGLGLVGSRGGKNISNTEKTTCSRHIISEPVSLKRSGVKSVSKRSFDSEGASEVLVELRSNKEMKILPESCSPRKTLLLQGPRLPKNGGLLTQVASVWGNAVFCKRQSESRPLVASCGKIVTRLASSLPIKPLDASASLKSYCKPTSKLESRKSSSFASTTSCPLSLKQSSNKLKLPPICPVVKYPNIPSSWRL